MMIFLFILIILVSILLVLAVLIQNPKGGGLSANLGGTNQVIGARKATDVVEKATWILGISLMALCLLTAVINPGATAEETRSAVQEQQMNNPDAYPQLPPPGQQAPPPAQTPPAQ